MLVVRYFFEQLGLWPIAHHVWAGNTRDSKTVPEAVAGLSERFAFRQVVFVGDRGMLTEKNLQVLENAAGDWGFLVGMTRRQNPEAEAIIDRVDEKRLAPPWSASCNVTTATAITTGRWKMAGYATP